MACGAVRLSRCVDRVRFDVHRTFVGVLVTIPAFGAYVYRDESARRKVIVFSRDAKASAIETMVGSCTALYVRNFVCLTNETNFRCHCWLASIFHTCPCYACKYKNLGVKVSKGLRWARKRHDQVMLVLDASTTCPRHILKYGCDVGSGQNKRQSSHLV